MAMGTASPSAHGQAITKTATAEIKAKDNPELNTKNHKLKVAIAIKITIGTKKEY